MTDMLIRDIPDEVIAGLDAHAARLGTGRCWSGTTGWWPDSEPALPG